MNPCTIIALFVKSCENYFAKNFNKFSKVREERDERNKPTWQNITDNSENYAIVIGVEYSFFILKKDKQELSARLSKNIPFSLSKTITVGDKVGFVQKGSEYFITYRFPRETFIARLRGDSKRSSDSLEEHVLVANVDTAVIVATTANPIFQPKMIDRYIIICEAGNVAPIICLNKCDLTEDRDPILKTYSEDLGIKIIETSAITGFGIEELKNTLKNKSAVVIGKSGVGKSSIVNAIIPELHTSTGEIGINEGRHVTTTSSLYEWDKNSFIIDTPGIRKLDVSAIDKSEFKKYFHEFDEYVMYCKFNDCLHLDEPESTCGIKQAVSRGLINKSRYENYSRICGE